jgi:LuxR family maltose regulon positive regulatory protein
MSSTSSPAEDPEYFTQYKNFALGRSASGVLTLRFHADGGPRTFDGTTHHDLPRLLEDFSAAEHLQSQLEGSHAPASQVTGWMLATQARLGVPGEARALLAVLADERAGSGEIRDVRRALVAARSTAARRSLRRSAGVARSTVIRAPSARA